MQYSKNIRTLVYTFTSVLSLGTVVLVLTTIQSPQVQIIRLTQLFAFFAIIYLYLTLLVSPLYIVFPTLPYRMPYTKARRALGVSAFFCGLIHACLAFFGQLGGFAGLFFLSNNYLLAISLGFLALQILTSMALTAFDKVIGRLTYPKWKNLHRLVYLAGILIIIHALMLGTHFQDLSQAIPQITFFFLASLLLLEAIRFDKYLGKKFASLPRLGPTLAVVSIGIVLYILDSFFPTSPFSLGIHAQHILLAQQAQTQQGLPSGNQALPGLIGDKTLRYTVSFHHEEVISPGTPTTLRFAVYNASSGEKVELFNRLYEKLVHLIIVDETLSYFNHIHPTQEANEFVIETTFPKEGRYHLYIDFQPFGAIEQQMAFTLTVGNPETDAESVHTPDSSLTKRFGRYKVSLTPDSFTADRISVGQEKMTFELRDDETDQPITTLKPYLAAFGHLVMIKQDTYDYIHVHPFSLKPPKPNENGGPQVEFLPLGLYGPIKPGIYRVFAQFNPDGELFTADFTIEIE